MVTIAQYIARLEEPRKGEITQLDRLIRQCCPKLKPYLHDPEKKPVIGYGKYAYTTKSGCSGEWFTVGLSSGKEMSLHIICSKDGMYTLAKTYQKKLPKATIGRSCIRFKTLADIDLAVIKQLLKEANQYGPALTAAAAHGAE